MLYIVTIDERIQGLHAVYSIDADSLEDAIDKAIDIEFSSGGKETYDPHVKESAK